MGELCGRRGALRCEAPTAAIQLEATTEWIRSLVSRFDRALLAVAARFLSSCDVTSC